MKAIFDNLSYNISKLITQRYSTSFSLGIYFLNGKFHRPIYAIYGFVRLADEIVDSFEGYQQEKLLTKFRADTYAAIENKISLNPVLNCFQEIVHQYNIDNWLIDTFLDSMEMDLHKSQYDRDNYEKYILGSAEVVGLMCLKVFTEGEEKQYEKLKPLAMKLGAAFQKINFLRDLKMDYKDLGRSYFPNVDLSFFNDSTKQRIEEEIEADFKKGFEGIMLLPHSSRFGVYVAYVYYYALFKKIRKTSSGKIMNQRIRIGNEQKMMLLLKSYIKYNFNLV